MFRRRLAAALIAGGLLTLGAPGPAAGATMDRAQALQTALRLKARLGTAERDAVALMLALPEDVQLSGAMATQLVPGWQLIRQRLLRLSVREINRHGPAHLTLQRLDRFAAQIQPVTAAVPSLGPFNAERYKAHTDLLTGRTSLPWPGLPDRMASFTNLTMNHPESQLADLHAYLRAYYTSLGLPVAGQPYEWQGQTHATVIATIPGDSDETVLLVDSDSATGTAALLEAAHLFTGRHLAKTVQLVHLNGAALPGGSAGARHFVARALAKGQRIAAVIVLERLGGGGQQDRVFRITAGSHPRSLGLADRALRAAGTVAEGYQPVVQPFDSPVARFGDTDGLVFSLAGFPVVLLGGTMTPLPDPAPSGQPAGAKRNAVIDWSYARAVASVGLVTALDAAADPVSRYADVQHAQAALQQPKVRIRHFQLALMNSLFYRMVAAREGALRRELTDAEMQAEMAADQARDGKGPVGEESVVNRIVHWFPESGFTPIDTVAILAEMRYLRRRAALSE